MKYFKVCFSQTQLIVYLLPLIVISGVFIFYFQKPFILVDPDIEQTIPNPKVKSYDDSYQQGKSTVTIIENKPTKLTYKYSISSAIPSPYAGVEFAPEQGSFLDLSRYDYLKVKIRASHGERITFNIGTYHTTENPKDFNFVYYENNIPYAFRIMASLINVEPDYKEIVIALKDLNTPEWWYVGSNADKFEIAAPDYSKVKYIYFGNCINIKPGIEDRVELTEIGFYKSYFNFYTISALCLIVYFAIAGLFFYKRNNSIEVNFNEGKLTSEVQFTKEEDIVFNYITTQYMNHELAVADIQNATGYTEKKISDIIKNKTGLNFKQFLNKLRISEAKRLILETDFNISEIAEKVGYANVTHFNRVFKTEEGKSPNEFRKVKIIDEKNHLQ